MEIKAKCTYDQDAVKALTHLALFKKADPKKRFILWNVTFLVLLAVIIFEIFLFGVSNTLILLAAIDVIWLLLAYFLYFGIPKLQYNALGGLKNIENEYIFSETSLKAVSQSKEYNGEVELEYSMLVKAYETKKYFFLFQANNQAFIIDKDTVENGKTEAIKGRLINALKDKYIICKY